MTQSNSIANCTAHGSALVVTIHAEQLRDMPVVLKLKEEITSAVQSGRSTCVVLNFSHVRFISSVAFLAFLGIRRLEGVKRIILSHLDDNIREVFEVCRLIPTKNHATAPFEEVPTVQAALDICMG